jgi:hypothetical protein
MVTDRRTGETIPMVIFISQRAIARYQYDATLGTGAFVRSADARGYIEFPGRWRTDLMSSNPLYSSEQAINFSTSWPG